MGERLLAGIPSRYVTSHPGQLSLLPSVEREMSTGQSAVLRCGYAAGSKGRVVHFIRG